MFLLDTDIISILQRQTQPQCGRLFGRMAKHPLSTFFYSIVSFHEQVIGAHSYLQCAKDNAGRIKGYEKLEVVLAEFRKAQVLAFDATAIAVFDALRVQKVRIGTMDLRIAAIALSQGMTVLTCNLRDFTQVPGLKVEDWTI